MQASLPGSISKITTMADNGIRVQFDTQEVQPEVAAELFNQKGKLGWFIFHEKQIREIDLDKLPDVKTDAGEKTPAQRLRSVLYVLWQQSNTQISSEQFYREKMEDIIEHLKTKIV